MIKLQRLADDIVVTLNKCHRPSMKRGFGRYWDYHIILIDDVERMLWYETNYGSWFYLQPIIGSGISWHKCNIVNSGINLDKYKQPYKTIGAKNG